MFVRAVVLSGALACTPPSSEPSSEDGAPTVPRGPEGTACPASNEVDEVRATFNHAAIVQAIQQVVDDDVVGDLVAGPVPRVPSCDCYADATGHLATCGIEAVATDLAGCL